MTPNPRELQIITTAEKPWDVARKLRLVRYAPMPRSEAEIMEPGVNFFILVLEHLGCTTRFSCEGHPSGFYVAFDAPLAIADRIQRLGWFVMELHHGRWIIRMPSRDTVRKENADPEILKRMLTARRNRTLRNAAKAWQRKLLQDAA